MLPAGAVRCARVTDWNAGDKPPGRDDSAAHASADPVSSHSRRGTSENLMLVSAVLANVKEEGRAASLWTVRRHATVR